MFNLDYLLQLFARPVCLFTINTAEDKYRLFIFYCFFTVRDIYVVIHWIRKRGHWKLFLFRKL